MLVRCFCLCVLHLKYISLKKKNYPDNLNYYTTKYILNLSFFFNFFILSLFLVNEPQALYVNPGQFKCLSGIILFPANIFFICSVILYFNIKEDPNKRIWLKGVLTPKLLNNPLASCYLRIFDFLPLHIENFDKCLILPFFAFITSGFLLCVFFLHLKQ